MRSLVIYIFFAVFSFSPAFAASKNIKCQIKHTAVCGTWISYGDIPENLIIEGKRLEWSGGDYAICDLSSELYSKKSAASILKCKAIGYDWKGNVIINEEKFFLFSITSPPYVKHQVLRIKRAKDLPGHDSGYNHTEYEKERCPVIDIFNENCWIGGLEAYAPTD